jgi:DNA-binding NarL/FixJ family response regulator
MNGNTAPVFTADDGPVKVILANDSRLLREMLRRVLGRAPQIALVAEVDDLRLLESVLAETAARWIIVSLTPEGEFPGIVKSLLQTHSTIHVLAIALDGSTVKVLHMEPNEQQINVLSVEEILSLLETKADQSLPLDQGD